jgi:hypothetical protein
MARGLARVPSDRKAVATTVRSVFEGRAGQADLDRRQNSGNWLIYRVISISCMKRRPIDESATKSSAAIDRFGEIARHQDAT